jgi:NAD(P)H dehydrogenase (quinone)
MIAITGANGHLGLLVVERLLKEIPANQIIAAVRAPENASHFAKIGVQVRKADYTRPETLRTALDGVKRLLLISASEVGRRFKLHKAVIDAAVKKGVELFVYTSLLRADSSELFLAGEHRQTEEYLQASGLPLVVLRNGWYLENHTSAVDVIIDADRKAIQGGLDSTSRDLSTLIARPTTTLAEAVRNTLPAPQRHPESQPSAPSPRTP